MSSEPVATESLASELVASVAQLDDSGANTADRYDWQAAMAAADGLALYLDALDEEGCLRPECKDYVLCEWHEDWILFSGDGVELVSGKHRDSSVGNYSTVNKLTNDGGLAHLFNRWAALKETPTCRLVTSGGLGSGDPRLLLAAAAHFRLQRSTSSPIVVSPSHAGIVAQLRDAIFAHCKDTSTRWSGNTSRPAVADNERDAEVARFLSALSITDSQLLRDHIAYAAPSMYVKPVLERMGVVGSKSAVWQAVLGLFRVRMRAQGRLPSGGLPVVLERGSDASAIPLETRRTMAKRTVTMLDIDLAITTALALPRGFEPVRRLPLLSKLAVKMSTGGCSDNAAERAQDLRSDYQNYWRDRESGETTARVERQRFERLLQRISDNATDSPQPQGTLLWRRLQAATDELEDKQQLPPGMDAGTALGGVCDLANQCKVWFGPRFDVDAAIVTMRAALEAEA